MDALIGTLGIVGIGAAWVLFGKYVFVPWLERRKDEENAEIEQELIDEYERKHRSKDDEK